jgi:hypothetical protein
VTNIELDNDDDPQSIFVFQLSIDLLQQLFLCTYHHLFLQLVDFADAQCAMATGLPVTACDGF